MVSIFFCVSQNNFISGTYVDSVDEYVFALCSNGIFILHYLSLERIVCYSIRLVFFRFCDIHHRKMNFTMNFLSGVKTKET